MPPMPPAPGSHASHGAHLVGIPGHDITEESGYEAIVYNEQSNSMLLVQESMQLEVQGRGRAACNEVDIKPGPVANRLLRLGWQC